jgi:hypothetical protein
MVKIKLPAVKLEHHKAIMLLAELDATAKSEELDDIAGKISCNAE